MSIARPSNLRTDINIGFRIAHRARLTYFLGALAIALVTASALAAQFSGRQPATVALDVGFSVMRLLLPVLIVLLLQELFYREFDRKYYFVSLTYPRARLDFLIGRGITVYAYAFGALILLSAILWLTASVVGRSYIQARPPSLGLPFVVTILFIALDLAIAIAVGILISIAATSSSFLLIGTLGFLLCARSFSPIIDLLNRDNTLVANSETYQSSLALLGYVFPDLAKLDVRLISLYDTMAFLPTEWPALTLSTLAYTGALLVLAAWSLNRRQFS